MREILEDLPHLPLETESRFPVGSSARRISGSLARARAMATSLALAVGELASLDDKRLKDRGRLTQEAKLLPSIACHKRLDCRPENRE